MSERQKRHLGRNDARAQFDPDRIDPDKPDAALSGLDPAEAGEDAREISRMLDEFEGYDRPEPKRQVRMLGRLGEPERKLGEPDRS